MPFIGNKPSAVPLTSADIADSIITSAKIVDATIANADIANSTIALAKLSATGTPSASTFLRGDNAWGEAGAAAGQVIQVLGATDTTSRSTSSSSFVTGSNTLSVTITPSSASNKILIIVTGSISTNDEDCAFTIYRASTNLGNATYGMVYALGGGDWPYHRGSLAMSYLDSPSTTSATTYQVYFKRIGATASASLNSAGATGSITCLEIKG